MEVICFGLGMILGLSVFVAFALVQEKFYIKESSGAENSAPETEKRIFEKGRPSFAQQWLNIMNYSGESQEEDYEETEVDSKNDLERVS